MNDVGFMISEDDLALGPGTRLDHFKSFSVAVLLKYKRRQRNLLT